MEEVRLRESIDKCVRIASEYEEPWRSIIFAKLIDRMLSVVDGPSDVTVYRADPLPTPLPDGLREGVLRLSHILGLTLDQVLRFYEFDESQPSVVLYDLSGGHAQAEIVREICGLHLLALDIVYGKETASLDMLREVCIKWRVYSSNNFSNAHLGKSNWFSRDGSEVKLTYVARQDLAKVAQRIINAVPG